MLATCGLVGCVTPLANHASLDNRPAEDRASRGYVFYLDGAGGGGALRNYAAGVRQGLLDAGYPGAGEIFNWETGAGVTVDQLASVEYKRKRAAELARKIERYADSHPGAPITLIGLSAGTAIAAFALEALPDDVSVDTVVMLSGSLSSSYDLSRALERVSGKMYVFRSSRDTVLSFLLPIAGSADRVNTKRTIGLSGVDAPRSAAARRQYLKIIEVPWNERFRDYGNNGGHTDSVKRRFIQAVVAPLIQTRDAPAVASAAQKSSTSRPINPAYQRWIGFQPGSWAMFEGTQFVEGRQHAIRARVTLRAVTHEHVIIERHLEGLAGVGDLPPVRRTRYISRHADPDLEPFATLEANAATTDTGRVTIRGRDFAGRRYRFSLPGEFPDWGADPSIEAIFTPEVPGGLAALRLDTTWSGSRTQLDLQLVDFLVVRQ